MSSAPAVLQIFNRYLERGGEEAAIRQFAEILKPRCVFTECIFESSEWVGPDAPPPWKQALLMLHNSSAAQRVLAAHDVSKAQVWLMHNIFPVASPSVYAAAFQRRIPVIQHIHNFRPWSITGYLGPSQALAARHWGRIYWREICRGSWRHSRLKTAILASLLCSMKIRGHFRSVAAWIAPSKFMRNRFIDAGLPPEKVFLSYLPHTVVNSEVNLPDEGYYLFLGRLIEEKGVSVLMDCWDQLRQEKKEKTPRLIMAGEGPLVDEVKKRASLNSSVEFRGFVTGEEKRRLLAGCRALIQPAVWAEPLSLVIYEAFDFGKPALVASSGGMPELVATGGGLIHTAGDPSHLARQVNEMEAMDPAARRKMGATGRAWLIPNTNADAWSRRFFEVAATCQR